MKLKIAIYCFLAIFLGAYALSASAEIYKWKDSTGKMIYSDTPPPEQKAKTLHIYNASTDAATKNTATLGGQDRISAMEDRISGMYGKRGQGNLAKLLVELEGIRARSQK